MTAWEQAERIVEEHCPRGTPINRKALTEAIRRAIIRADIDNRQPKELSPAQAGTMVYQILFFVDEWIRTLEGADYPDQANRLRQCRAKILAIAKGELTIAPRRENTVRRAKAKGVGA